MDNQNRTDSSAHCARVAWLCASVAAGLGLPPSLVAALGRAAIAHEEGCAEGDSAAAGILREWRGLRDLSAHPSVKLAAGVLDICDGLDEAVEFSAYEGTSIAEAAAEFLGDYSGADGKTINSLRRFVSPRCAVRMTGDLPVLPRAVSRLLATSPETASAVELESIAGSDPVLAARVVGAANSASFGSRSSIQHLNQAILRVGVPFARKVLLAACLEPLFASPELRDLWNHSREVASAAHELAPACGVDQETAYLTGLLHDIGRLVLQRAPPATRVEEAALRRSGFPLVYAETMIYGKDHASVGADLLRSWSLPDAIVEAVLHHHRPESTGSELAGLLCLAEDCCGSESENLTPGMRRAAARRLTGVAESEIGQPDNSAAIFAIAS